jgi:hypothetical protein
MIVDLAGTTPDPGSEPLDMGPPTMTS